MGTGWKGKAGAIAAMLAGIAGLVNDFAQGTMTMERAVGFFTAISAGFSLFGIRQAVGPSKAADQAG